MPKFKVKTNNCRLTVRARLGINEELNEREFEFFTAKYIRGFMKAQRIRKFGFNGVEYSGPVGISLSARLKKPVSKYDFLFLMEQIVDIVQKAQEESLSMNKIMWNLDYVFINETTKETQFMYLPLEDISGSSTVTEFVESVIYSAKPKKETDDDYISRFVYYLKSLNNFNLDQIEQFISSEDRSVVNTIKKQGNAASSGFMTDKQRDYYKHYEPEEYDEATGLLSEYEATGLLGEDEGTMLLNEDEETTLLCDEDEGTTLLDENASQVHYATLYRTLTQENISINKPVFRIGKERNYTDYFVANNSAVSRSHADIITRGTDYYVIDLNSKNKTYINEQPIPVQQEMPLHDGDKLRLANEEFVFYI